MAVASSDFSGVDLSRLPAPDVVETLSFETLLGQWLTSFQGYCTEAGIDYSAILESDPAYKLLEAGAYREMVLRQRVNDAARAVMVAYAQGGDLDQLAALMDVEREILTPADPANGIDEIDEADDDLRRRTVLAPQSYSVAGPEGAYLFHALSADPTITDVSIDSPSPGQVLVTVLVADGNGTPAQAVLDAVTARLNADSIRPLTDEVIVAGAVPLDYAIAATLTFFSSAARSVALTAAQTALAAYVASCRKLGVAVTRAGIIGALMVDGVENVALPSPPADIVPGKQQVGNCTAMTVTDGGTV
ncbi:phage baseplate assembly protein [Novosphingobium nitrogenifigens DSM 19370]|uniref:Phage baseplate assembly protein n=1 Tax=Novosphingobium nitrogenifigens DSM 19370 TaxID=983920 RepID=F1Z9B9_9SPHN|nr:baseplate J/gp47 family protein [Novosphingobium nitrogenifigens]EGD58386.1 phage baseplate assembly protein [Novosphingobium nitrogenifigens DSM 19370]